MADKDYSPLSASCVRALNDKLYEKRKVAALEIEKMVKDFMAANNSTQVKKLLRVLGQDFTMSQNPNTRKGGLIGLAATAIALGKDSPCYVNELVKPVLTCFFDSDSRIRYYGCEALYNIVKVARGSVLPFFNDIFDGLSKLSADPDQNVRSGSELLDRLMKDIVTESCVFDLVAFMPLLQERILTRNPFARQFVVSWILTLEVVPDINMLIYLPEILDGLFQVLGDTNLEIRQMCEGCLGEFLRNIAKGGTVDFPSMANILVVHSQSTDTLIQFTAISWLKEFIQLSGRTMLPFTSGILAASLPCLAYEDDRKNIREAAKAVSTSLMKLVYGETEVSGPGSEGKQSIVPVVENATATEKSVASPVLLDVSSVVSVLTRQLLHDSTQTRITALRWIYHIFIKLPRLMFGHVEELFPLLLKTLSDPSDEVVLLDLEVLAEISSSPAGHAAAQGSCLERPLAVESGALPLDVQRRILAGSHELNVYFTRFMVSLLKLFSTDRALMEDRGSFIVRQLCLLLSAEDIYSCCSEILLLEDDVAFASQMIQALSTILLTSTELFDLRMQLKGLASEASCELFCCLYKSWCHNPVSTVSLCFLTQNYRHASQLLALFGDLEVTVEFLTEIDKLVQLIESPIFTYLRLQLLDVECNQHLVKSLYGLLMLLPQTDAFRTLQHRLQCIPNIQFTSTEQRLSFSTLNAIENGLDKRLHLDKIDFAELLAYFARVQDKHRVSRRQSHSMHIRQKSGSDATRQN